MEIKIRGCGIARETDVAGAETGWATSKGENYIALCDANKAIEVTYFCIFLCLPIFHLPNRMSVYIIYNDINCMSPN